MVVPLLCALTDREFEYADTSIFTSVNVLYTDIIDMVAGEFSFSGLYEHSLKVLQCKVTFKEATVELLRPPYVTRLFTLTFHLPDHQWRIRQGWNIWSSRWFSIHQFEIGYSKCVQAHVYAKKYKNDEYFYDGGAFEEKLTHHQPIEDLCHADEGPRQTIGLQQNISYLGRKRCYATSLSCQTYVTTPQHRGLLEEQKAMRHVEH